MLPSLVISGEFLISFPWTFESFLIGVGENLMVTNVMFSAFTWANGMSLILDLERGLFHFGRLWRHRLIIWLLFACLFPSPRLRYLNSNLYSLIHNVWHDLRRALLGRLQCIS